MYIVTKTSAVWVEESAPCVAASVASADAASVDGFEIGPAVRWAARSLKLPHLTCLGLRFRDGLLCVCVVRKGKRQWMPASSVLRETDLRRWIERDFVRL